MGRYRCGNIYKFSGFLKCFRFAKPWKHSLRKSLPVFIARPSALLISIRHAVPPLGSTPPNTHASRWFPIITRRSTIYRILLKYQIKPRDTKFPSKNKINSNQTQSVFHVFTWFFLAPDSSNNIVDIFSFLFIIYLQTNFP